MTYAELCTAVRAEAFPEGEAVRLKPHHNSIVLDGLIELQRRVPLLRVHQYDLFDFEETYYQAGLTVVDKPAGVIERVYTYTRLDHGDRIEALPKSVAFVRALGESVRLVYDSTGTLDDADLGKEDASVSFNKNFRTIQGVYYAIDDTDILIYPHIEDTEKVAVEWRGIRRDWTPNEDDEGYPSAPTLNIEGYERSVISALVDYLKWKSGGRYTLNTDAAAIAKSAFVEAAAELYLDTKRDSEAKQGNSGEVKADPNATATTSTEA